MERCNHVQYDGEKCEIYEEDSLPSKSSSRDDADPDSGAAAAAAKFSNKECWRILKNVVGISVAFMCLFTAFQSMSNLQSSINSAGDLGTISLTTIYLALIVSCVFLPSIVLRLLTCKWAMVVCTFCYSLYMLAQFYPSKYTLIPAAVVLGLGAAPLWSAKCTYLTQTGMVYAEIIKDASEPIIVRFFGIFFLFFQSSQIWGNLISSLVLNPGQRENVTTISDEQISLCGFNFCPVEAVESNNTNLDRPAEHRIYTLAGIFLGLAVFSSVIIVVLIDNLERYGEKDRVNNAQDKGALHLVSATMMHLKKPYQLLIIPLTLWSGFEQAFITADFTKAFVTCSWGVHRVGLVMIVYGVCDAICSISFGFVIKKIGRVPIFIFGALINYIVIGICIHWTPNPEDHHMFFVIAALWGTADAVWQTQINAFYGVIFPHTFEAAFSNYKLWESIGFAVAFAYNGVFCVSTKIYVLIAVLTAGMIGYLAIELCEKKGAKGKLEMSVR